MSLAPGTTLGPYQIETPLGAGGMGEVYKATDTRLDRTVAIKVLPAHVAADPDLKQRFEREAKTISSLNHPHICTLYDIGSQDGIDFLVMEYLDGDLRQVRFRHARVRQNAISCDYAQTDHTSPTTHAAAIRLLGSEAPIRAEDLQMEFAAYGSDGARGGAAGRRVGDSPTATDRASSPFSIRSLSVSPS